MLVAPGEVEEIDSEQVSWGLQAPQILRQDTLAQSSQVWGRGTGGRKRVEDEVGRAGITGWETSSDLVLPVSIGGPLLSKPRFLQK